MDENVVGKINLILLNAPSDVSDLHKLRYYYKMLGNLFSYDSRIIYDESIGNRKVDYDNIGRYQTCVQIAEIFNVILNNLNESAKASIVSRRIEGTKKYETDHVANAVRFTDSKTGLEYNLLLDLTLDLYRIQSGLQTRQFGFTTDALSTYDIISLRECEQLDKDLGLYNPFGYKETDIKRVKEVIKPEMSITEKLNIMWSNLKVNFEGSNEARGYFTELLREAMPEVGSNTYNLYYKQDNSTDFVTLYILDDKEYILVDNKIGMVVSSKDKVKDMLKYGWKTSSLSLTDTLNKETSSFSM